MAAREGLKYDMGKARVDLLPPDALFSVARVFEYGANKYGDRNWELGMDWNRLYAAAMRHMLKWQSGEDADPESGLSHIDHAICSLMFLSAFEYRTHGKDDRSKTLLELRANGKPVLDLKPYEIAEQAPAAGNTPKATDIRPVVEQVAQTFLSPSTVAIDGQ